MRKKALVFASISGCLAVILGALGAHQLTKYAEEGVITQKSLHAFQTATEYQLLHSILMLTLIALQFKVAMYFKYIMYLLAGGIILFSGSIYILVYSEVEGISANWAGPLTPVGGVCLIASWFLLVLSAFKFNEKSIPGSSNNPVK